MFECTTRVSIKWKSW